MADQETQDPYHDKLLDHDYDGIREYDNPLPGWWKWMFAISIVVAYPYLLHYHFGKGLTLPERLDREVEVYALQLLATYGELSPDRETLMSYMQDDTAMAGMAGLFRGRCAQCHLADGSGNVGPNLTDDLWINVKDIEDIPRIIRDGLPVKGMPGWGDRLTETQIVLLGSFVARLRNNPVDGKKPEGDLLPRWEDLAPAHSPEADEAVAETADNARTAPPQPGVGTE